MSWVDYPPVQADVSASAIGRPEQHVFRAEIPMRADSEAVVASLLADLARVLVLAAARLRRGAEVRAAVYWPLYQL